ncbi:MAG: polysaccharide pyruvyl transferase family protein [Oscillospiraceae bacterium]|nr:polysaccharide pyruvyl transferase family protein [Oscillospiraceae bacterium]
MAGNVGDTVLSQCVRRLFDSVYHHKFEWNLLRVNDPVDTDVVLSINDTDSLIIGGGGLFLPDTNKNNVSGWQWAISGDLLKKIKVPVVVFSVGYNYFPGQEPEELFIENLELLCKKASFIGLRNTGSVEAVKRLLPGELAEKIKFQPCTTTLIRKIYGDELPEKKQSKRIAFNVAFDRAERRFQGDLDKICDEIAVASKRIEADGYEIVLVYHCDDDYRIKRYMKDRKVKFDEANLTWMFPDKVYQFYNDIECVFGMRGHAQMIPFGLNCKIITLGTHDKMRWFLEDIDATDWYIDLIANKESLSSIIYSKFHEIMKDSEKTDKRIREAQDRLWSITRDNMSQITEITHVDKSEDK